MPSTGRLVSVEGRLFWVVDDSFGRLDGSFLHLDDSFWRLYDRVCQQYSYFVGLLYQSSIKSDDLDFLRKIIVEIHLMQNDKRFKINLL